MSQFGPVRQLSVAHTAQVGRWSNRFAALGDRANPVRRVFNCPRRCFGSMVFWARRNADTGLYRCICCKHSLELPHPRPL